MQSLLRAHQPETVDAEFRTMLRLYLASREVRQTWYESQKPGGAASRDSFTTGTP